MIKKKGILSKVRKFLFSSKVEDSSSFKIVPKKEGKYKCHICERMIDEQCALTHVKAEEYLISLIKKDHPQWKDKDSLCSECVDYYRKLVKDGEI